MRRTIHFSVDDIIEAFEWLCQNERTVTSIFEAQSFHILKGLHEKYGIHVSCFCFYRRGAFNLSMVPDRWREEFQDNSGWLRFGFHGYDESSNYNNAGSEQAAEEYEMVTGELERITGGGDCITPAIRIHFCSGNEAMTAALAERGVKRLFCGDDDRINYGLPVEANKTLLREGQYRHPEKHLLYSVTHVRLEKMRTEEGLAGAMERIASTVSEELVVFTHEKYLTDENVMKHLEGILTTDAERK